VTLTCLHSPGPNTHLAAQAHLSYYLSNTMSPVQPSFQRGIFPSPLKHALVTPHLTKARIGPRHCQLLQAHLQFIIYLQTRRTTCRQALYEQCQPTHSASSPTTRLLTVPLYRDSGTQRPQRSGSVVCGVSQSVCLSECALQKLLSGSRFYKAYT